MPLMPLGPPIRPMSPIRVAMLCCVIAVLGAGVALARPLDRNPSEPYFPPPPPPPPPPPEPPPPAISLTLSPFHLPLPLLEVTGELRLTDRYSASLIAGIGQFSDTNGIDSGLAAELGAQVSYYIYRPFRGLHVGGEVLYVYIGDIAIDPSLTGSGLVIGPFVGWKYIHRNGFTFLAQGGIEVGVVQAQSSTAMQSERRVFPLINLNVGWSFL